MPLIKLPAGDTPGTSDGLCAHLERLCVDIKNLKRQIDRAAKVRKSADIGYCPRQMRALGVILDRGYSEIRRKISSVCEIAPERDEASAALLDEPEREFDLVEFMTEFRSCCRRLCTALHTALRASDEATGAYLCNLALSLERQLWLMDTRPNNHDLEYSRVVSLFLAC
jgi:hypothetical protein